MASITGCIIRNLSRKTKGCPQFGICHFGGVFLCAYWERILYYFEDALKSTVSLKGVVPFPFDSWYNKAIN